MQKGHHLHKCPAVEEYINTGRVIIRDNWIHLPNGQPVPNDGTGHGIKASIDNWLTVQYLSQAVAPTAWIKEVVETHILQVAEFSSPPAANELENEAMDIFEVFTAQKKKQEDKVTKLPKLSRPAMQTTSAPLPTTQPKPPSTLNKPGPQYCYQATTKDQCLVSELQALLLDGKLTQTMPAHILATSPTIHKELIKRL
jgi:type IV secretory pathway VirB10-like protein